MSINQWAGYEEIGKLRYLNQFSCPASYLCICDQAFRQGMDPGLTLKGLEELLLVWLHVVWLAQAALLERLHGPS